MQERVGLEMDEGIKVGLHIGKFQSAAQLAPKFAAGTYGNKKNTCYKSSFGQNFNETELSFKQKSESISSGMDRLIGHYLCGAKIGI